MLFFMIQFIYVYVYFTLKLFFTCNPLLNLPCLQVACTVKYVTDGAGSQHYSYYVILSISK